MRFSNLKAVLVLVLTLLYSNINAQASLMVLIDHRHFKTTLRGPQRYKAMACARRASEKGSGIFGHAWIWLYGSDAKGRSIDIELGHTGETDPTSATYFESLVASAVGRANPNPVSVLYCDRWDGLAQRGSGGHRPDAAYILNLSEDQLQSVLSWLSKKSYEFDRYNLVDHQCCHFALEALHQAGLDIKISGMMSLPRRVSVAGVSLLLWSDPQYRQLPILTPWQLAQALQSDSRLQEGLATYFKAKRSLSKLPWVRAWQKRENFVRLIRFAPTQVQREVWALSWKEEF